MERLTDKDGKKETWNLININTNDITIKGYSDSVLLRVINKLWHYENTGLEPSEVEQLQAKLEIWNRFNKEDSIHKGEKATERDYYYYTNGASSVLENEVEQLKANQNKIAIEKLGELENWINQPYTKGDCYYLNRGATIETTDLQQKIKELKGDK